MTLTVPTALLGALMLAAGGGGDQAPGPGSPPQPAQVASPPPAAAGTEKVDVFDLIRKVRRKEETAEPRAAAEDPTRRMYAVAPVVGYKPSSGVMFGAAGNLAFYAGDPATTHISSGVGAFTFSSLKQTSATVRFGAFARDDGWKIDGDNRFQWTSQDTFGLGTATTEADRTNVKFDYFRIYETVYRSIGRGLFAGLGFHYSAHTDTKPGKNAEATWNESPYVIYSEEHHLPLDSQTSAGTSVSLLADTRDNAINASRGWLASVSYRAFFNGFLGGDSTWQQLSLDTRTYRTLSKDCRHTLAFWMSADLVVGGVAPYLDLPATGMDSYGRSGRGYAEGRFRGERMLYGEIEYRGTLTRNGLLGVVAFVNTSTFANTQTGEQLFDGFATGAGAGLRLLMNKRSKTNICLDVGWGKQGSRGVYLAIQEAF